MPMIPLIGFAPDIDPMTPGVISDCDGIIPTLKGFKPEPGEEQFAEALDDTVVGAFLARYLDGSQRVLAATSADIFEYQADGKRNSIGSGYSASDRWRFAMFGNDVIATDFDDVVQVASGAAGTFGALSGSPPRARIVVTTNNFVFLLNTNVQGNQWHCSGIGDATSWTPDPATQAARNTLDSTPGEITAGWSLNNDLVVFKKRGMYLGQYLGPPIIWGFQEVSAIVGTFSQEAVVDIGDRLVFPSGNHDFYIYDGGRPQPLESPLREFFFRENLDQNRADEIIGRFDREHWVATWHYPSVDASSGLDKQISWHIKSNRWTIQTRDVEYVILPEVPISLGTTYDGFGSLYTNFGDDIPLTFGSSRWAAFPKNVPALFKSDHIPYTLTGTPSSSWIETGDTGDDTDFSFVKRVKPKFSSYPGTPSNITCQNKYRTNLGGSLTTDQQVELALQGWFNLRRNARFHRFRFDFQGDYEIIGYEPVVDRGGLR